VNKKTKIILVIVGVVVIIGAGIIGYEYWTPKSAVAADTRQAVFLTNGQVYFGDLKKQDSNYLYLTDIYYLKSYDPTNPTTSSQKIALVKLGNELHGPEDAMQIERLQVLYWENMRPNSKINLAIDKYEAGKQ
jgi:hypothetical protein